MENMYLELWMIFGQFSRANHINDDSCYCAFNGISQFTNRCIDISKC